MRRRLLAGAAAIGLLLLLAPAASATDSNWAAGVSYTKTPAPAAGYADSQCAGCELTDGLHAVAGNWSNDVGFQNANPTLTFDLGAAHTVSSVVWWGQQALSSGIDNPTSFAVTYSADSTTWSTAEVFTDGRADAQDTPYSFTMTLAAAASARYWRIVATRSGEWTFVDEVQLLGTDPPPPPPPSPSPSPVPSPDPSPAPSPDPSASPVVIPGPSTPPALINGGGGGIPKPIDALLGVGGTLAGWVGDALPDGHLDLPATTGLSSLLGKVNSLVPISGPMTAAVLVLAAVVAFIALRLVLVLWNLIWP